jgi:hypothetical protein
MHVHCTFCTVSEDSGAHMCTVTKVSAVSDAFDVVHLYCILFSFRYSDVMQFCHIVCSFSCSGVVHNCRMLLCALLWQCLQFPILLGYAHLPQHLESQILWWCALLLVCYCFRFSDVVQCYCSVCHFRCSNIVHYYPVCEVSYCPTLCVITAVSTVSSASTSFSITTVSAVSDVLYCALLLQCLQVLMLLLVKCFCSICGFRCFYPKSCEVLYCIVSGFCHGPGSVVGIATDYGLDDPGIESRWGARFSPPVQTCPGAHPASCTMGTGSFPGVKTGWGMTLTPHPLLLPWSWKGRAIPLLPLQAVCPVQSLSACTRVHITFYFSGFCHSVNEVSALSTLICR